MARPKKAQPLQQTPAPTKAAGKIEKPPAATSMRKVQISMPKFEHAYFHIRGTSPLVINAFAQKQENEMREKQEKGSQARKGKEREAKDFLAAYEGAFHRAVNGNWAGISAAAFRSGMIRACSLVNFKMTMAKCSLFVTADGFDHKGNPLVRIIKGDPMMDIRPVRVMKTTDIRARPMWPAGWEARVHVRWDTGQFSAEDVVNLMARVGMQVGVGEGRADSRNSAGMGWGEFELVM